MCYQPGLAWVGGGWKGVLVLALFLGVAIAIGGRSPSTQTQIRGQYIFTERNNQKYLSMKVVWPAAFDQYVGRGQPVIFSMIPHGAAPLGVTCYPLWTKFCGVLCHWTTAPIVLKLPLVGGVLRCATHVTRLRLRSSTLTLLSTDADAPSAPSPPSSPHPLPAA